MRSPPPTAHDRFRAAGILFPLMLLLSVGAHAEGIAAWFDTSPSSAVYAGIRSEVASLAASAAARGVPESLFVRRLAEGAEKRIPPERLISALRDDAERFTDVALMLSDRRLLPSETAPAGELIWQGGLLLRAGVTSADIAAALGAAASIGGMPTAGDAYARARRAFEALGTAVSLNARYSLSPDAFARLAVSIVRSPLDRGVFASLVSIFARGRASGLSADTVADIVVRVLDSGGSFGAIEREMQRRTRYQ
jgi:hypothetical protein